MFQFSAVSHCKIKFSLRTNKQTHKILPLYILRSQQQKQREQSENRHFNSVMYKSMINPMDPDVSQRKRPRKDSANITKEMASPSGSISTGNNRPRSASNNEENSKLRQLEQCINAYAMELNNFRKEKYHHSQEIDSLKQELANIKKSLDGNVDQATQNAELTSQKARHDSYFREKDDRIRSLVKELQVKEGREKHLQEQLSKVELENKQLKEKYHIISEQKSKFEKLADRNCKKYHQLEEKNDKLENALGKIAQLKAELKAAHAKIEEQSVIAKRNVGIHEKLEMFLNKNREETANLHKENERLKTENTRLNLVNSELQYKMRDDYTYARSTYQSVIKVARSFCDLHPDLTELNAVVKAALSEDQKSRQPHVSMERLVKSILDQYLEMHGQVAALNVHRQSKSAMRSLVLTCHQQKEMLPKPKSYIQKLGRNESHQIGHLGSSLVLPTNLDPNREIKPNKLQQLTKMLEDARKFNEEL